MAAERTSRTRSRFANPLSLVGLWVAAVCLLVILFLMVIEGTSDDTSPYTGIVTFVLLPSIMIAGLALAGFGAWRETKRLAEGDSERAWPKIDLGNARHRNILIYSTVGGVLFIGLSAFGSFKAYEYTDSNEFCATVCHTVMEPEGMAYENSPHARVHCVDCHIGPGAEWFVRSKISGAYQLYAVTVQNYPRPIHTPIKNLRPSKDICEQCHWPSRFVGDMYLRRDYYLSDDDNTHSALDLLMRVGGGDEEHGPKGGIHWHVSEDHKVEYYASDERRQEIPWIRVTDANGDQVVYVDEEADFDPTEIDEAEIRTMDCIDCHNRPSHRYLPPNVAVNKALTHGDIDVTIPGIKAVAVELLDSGYETKPEALTAIEEGLLEHFESEIPERLETEREELQRTIEAVKTIYERNYFPEMKTDWTSHTDNIGHLRFPGCMRCHTESHVAEETGANLKKDCNTCHYIMQRADPTIQLASTFTIGDFQHPEDIDRAWEEMPCTECHAP